MRGLGIGARVERMDRTRGERVGMRLVEVQVDVAEGEPSAIGLAP